MYWSDTSSSFNVIDPILPIKFDQKRKFDIIKFVLFSLPSYEDPRWRDFSFLTSERLFFHRE